MQQFYLLVIASFLLVQSCGENKSSGISPDLVKKIQTNTQFKTVYDRAETLVASGFNAGSGYSEVWIRDLNTFTEVACKVSDKAKLREAIIVFFKFQGEDGNIMDGYTEMKNANSGGIFYYSDLAPGLAAHKNTVETDQETSLIQTIYKYIKATGDRTILDEVIAGKTVGERMAFALDFLMTKRYDQKYGLIWGATTADWGDVQPEHGWGVVIDSSTHYAIDIYDNAMFIIALNNYIELIDNNDQKTHWKQVKDQIAANSQKYLWDTERQKYIPHLYLKDSPFPADFDENKIYYHGGTAVAIEAGLLTKEQVKQAYHKMQENVKAANAQTIGLTLYPVYPQGYFYNKIMGEYNYQNGGDWTWFGGRMVQQLIAYELYEEAHEAILPMLDRVIVHNGFYEWWTPAGEPKGSGMFRGSAGVLWTAIEQLQSRIVSK